MSATVSPFSLRIDLRISLFVNIFPLPFSPFLDFYHPMAVWTQQHQIAEWFSEYSCVCLVVDFKPVSAVSPTPFAPKPPVEPQRQPFSFPFVASQVSNILCPSKPCSLLFHLSPSLHYRMQKCIFMQKFAGLEPTATHQWELYNRLYHTSSLVTHNCSCDSGPVCELQ